MNANAIDIAAPGSDSFLLAPGHLTWELLSALSPTAAASIAGPEGIPGDGIIALLAISAWFAGILVGVSALRLLARILVRWAHAVRFWLSNWAEDLRVGVKMRLKRLDWRQKQEGFVQQEVELDMLDLAVLDHGATLAPGFAITVTDLAEQLKLRPSSVEKSLNKLHQHKLVDPLLGSTDGFGNYCLTDSGAWFVAAHRQNGEMRLEPRL